MAGRTPKNWEKGVTSDSGFPVVASRTTIAVFTALTIFPAPTARPISGGSSLAKKVKDRLINRELGIIIFKKIAVKTHRR